MEKELVDSFVKYFFDSVLPLIIMPNALVALSNKVRLNRVNKLDGKIIVDKMTTLKIEGLKSSTIDYSGKEMLWPLVCRLCEYVSDGDLANMKNNLSTIKVEKRRVKSFGFVGATYNPQDNHLRYSTAFSIGHDFLHVASSRYDKSRDVILSGFRQQKGSVYIGRGLTEGYTQLLSRRILGDKNRRHKDLTRIMELMEFLFDNPKDLEHYYFNADLPMLIRELERYVARDEALDFMIDLDSLEAYASAPFSPIGFVKSIKSEIRLYDMFMSRSAGTIKEEAFTELINKRKITSLILGMRKLKLHRDVLYVSETDHKAI